MAEGGKTVTALHKKRRRLLLWSAPVMLLAVLLAVKLLSLPLLAGQSATSFAANQGDGTLRAAHGLGTLNVVERYKAPFALGDGYVLKGDFAQARSSFAAALVLAPAAESCKVRVNLVLSLERLGDARAEAGDPASALAFYQEGSAMVGDAPQGCFTPQGEGNGEGEGDKLKAAGERLGHKQEQPADPAEGDGQEGAPQDPADAPAPAQEKMDQLKNQGTDAQKGRAKSQQLKQDYAQDSPKAYDKPW